jgi:hypothetical protein
MKPAGIAVVAALAVSAFAAFAEDTGITKVRVPMRAIEHSGESGTATLTSLGDERTQVDISVKGEPKGVVQPAHIHEGNCAKLNPQPKYGLNNVVEGKSSTQVPVGIDALRTGKLAVNVHKSTQDISTYVSCGDIPKPSSKKH